ncbi:MAG TPA: PHP domain-containing protein [Gemmatimonadales bacterium]|nr:PHP domain-containing protein [Gemmatimonadales bacterium]
MSCRIASCSICSASPSPRGRPRRAPTAHVDLHCHSTASDGECPPEQVPVRAHEANLAAIALTDHDTLDGVKAATTAALPLGVRVIPGCEFSVKAPWGEMHLLGYFLTPGHPALEAFLTETREARRRRGHEMVQRLQRAGVPIDLADVEAEAKDGALGRPHVARALVRRGAADDFTDAFARFLGRGKPGYVPKPLPTLEAVTALIHDVGGVAVAAHLGERGTEPQLRQFQSGGLDGIEIRHPRHSPAAEARLGRLAERLGLVVSGGSDWHGDGDEGASHAPLGGMDVPLEWLEKLELRRS